MSSLPNEHCSLNREAALPLCWQCHSPPLSLGWYIGWYWCWLVLLLVLVEILIFWYLLTMFLTTTFTRLVLDNIMLSHTYQDHYHQMNRHRLIRLSIAIALVYSRLQLEERLKSGGPIATMLFLVQKLFWHKNIWNTNLVIQARTEGLSTLYRGCQSTVTAVSISNFVYFYSFHGLKV